MLKYQKYVIYRGKKTPLSKLKPNSAKKIAIVCPECGASFERYFFILRKSGCFLCQKCAIKDKLSKTLEIGLKRNRLTVLGPSSENGKSIFKCDCGNKCVIANRHFLTGKTKSCGCLRSENLKRNSVHLTDSEHWNWQGGITGERQNEMAKAKYHEWRERIFELNNYTCQKCGQRGGELNAHHIRNYTDNKDMATDIENGITLCGECHRLFHKIYTRRNNNRDQLEEFLGIFTKKNQGGK